MISLLILLFVRFQRPRVVTQFELEMDNSGLFSSVVNLLSKISINGGDLSDKLVNFITKIRRWKSYNIELDLEDFSEHLKRTAIPLYLQTLLL